MNYVMLTSRMILALGATALFAAADSLSAQQGLQATRTPQGWRISYPDGATTSIPGISTLLARFDREAPPGGYVPDNSFYAVLTVAEQLPRATVDSVLDGLQLLAGTSPRKPVRTAAVHLLGYAGRSWPERRAEGVARRLAAIYTQSSDTLVRSVLVGYVFPQLTAPGPVLPVLRQVATQAHARQDFPEASDAAIWTLRRIGPRGHAVLRDLHRRGDVRDPLARSALATLIQNGFRDPGRP